MLRFMPFSLTLVIAKQFFVLPFFSDNKISQDETIHICSQKAQNSVLRVADNGLTTNVEAGVDEDGSAGGSLIGQQDVVIAGIDVSPEDLRPRRTVDVHNGGRFVAAALRHIIGDGHELRGVRGPIVEALKERRRIDLAHHGRKRHELGALQLTI